MRVRIAFGSRAAAMKDNLYIFERGHLFTSPYVQTEQTDGAYGMILLSGPQTPLHVTTDDDRGAYHAVAIKPLIKRYIEAKNAQLICISVNVLHPQFKRFRSIADPGVLQLPRAAFAEYNDAIKAAYFGTLSRSEAALLFEQLVAIAARFMPTPRCSDDSRVRQTIALLNADPDCALSTLAAQAGLSMHRMSHLFSDVVGLSLRSYRLWCKLNAIGQLASPYLSLTEIAHRAGFHDLPHMDRTFRRFFGAAPSYFLRSSSVRCFCLKRLSGVRGDTRQQTRVIAATRRMRKSANFYDTQSARLRSTGYTREPVVNPP